MIETMTVETYGGNFFIRGKFFGQDFLDLLKEQGKEGWWYVGINPFPISSQELLFQRFSLEQE